MVKHFSSCIVTMSTTIMKVFCNTVIKLFLLVVLIFDNSDDNLFVVKAQTNFPTDILGECWNLEQQLPVGTSVWYPGDDRLSSYHARNDVDEFLFTLGDFTKWIIIKKVNLI